MSKIIKYKSKKSGTSFSRNQKNQRQKSTRIWVGGIGILGGGGYIWGGIGEGELINQLLNGLLNGWLKRNQPKPPTKIQAH